MYHYIMAKFGNEYEVWVSGKCPKLVIDNIDRIKVNLRVGIVSVLIGIICMF